MSSTLKGKMVTKNVGLSPAKSYVSIIKNNKNESPKLF